MDQDEADVDIMFVSQRVDSLEFPFSPRSPLVVEQLLNFLGFQHCIRCTPENKHKTSKMDTVVLISVFRFHNITCRRYKLDSTP